jgi:hypothetical protein
MCGLTFFHHSSEFFFISQPLPYMDMSIRHMDYGRENGLWWGTTLTSHITARYTTSLTSLSAGVGDGPTLPPSLSLLPISTEAQGCLHHLQRHRGLQIPIHKVPGLKNTYTQKVLRLFFLLPSSGKWPWPENNSPRHPYAGLTKGDILLLMLLPQIWLLFLLTNDYYGLNVHR